MKTFLRKGGDARRTVFILLTVSVFIAFTISFVAYLRAEELVYDSYESRFKSFELANQLRQTSDDLTRMVRTYVSTGDPTYKAHYQEILDIRNGIKPRPLEYSKVYWDLVLSNDKRPRGATDPVSLLILMKKAGFTESEFDELRRAQIASDKLTATELAAMSLVEPASEASTKRRFQAILMLNNQTYHEAKAKIMKPIGEFQEMVDRRTTERIKSAIDKKNIMLWLFSSLGLFLLFGMFELIRLMTEERNFAKKNARLFSAVFNNAAIGLAQVSIDGKFERTNSQFCEITSYSPDEMLSSDFSFQKITHPDDVEASIQHMNSMLAGNEESFTAEKRYIRKNGDTIWVSTYIRLQRDALGNPEYFIVAAVEISDRKAIEEELRFQSDALGHMEEGIYAVTDEGIFIYTNQKFNTIFGYESRELIGKHVSVCSTREDDGVSIAKIIRRAIQDSGGGSQEICCTRKNGEIFWGQVSISKFNHAALGRVWIGILRDITSERNLRKDLEQAFIVLHHLADGKQQEIEQLRRELAREVHDEISASLTGIRMQLEFLASEYASGGSLSVKDFDGVQDLVRQTMKRSKMLCTRLRPPMLDDIGLLATFRWYISEWMQQSRIGATVNIQSMPVDPEEPLRTDLFRILQELLTNVGKHSGAQHVDVTLTFDDNSISLTVSDDGNGFKEDSEAGLGLLGIRERLHRYRGKMTVRNQPHEVTVMIVVPIAL